MSTPTRDQNGKNGDSSRNGHSGVGHSEATGKSGRKKSTRGAASAAETKEAETKAAEAKEAEAKAAEAKAAEAKEAEAKAAEAKAAESKSNGEGNTEVDFAKEAAAIRNGTDKTAQQAFSANLAAALGLPEVDVQQFKGDAALLNHNCKLGVTAVLAREADITDQLPRARMDLISNLTAISLAFYYSDIRLETQPATRGQIAAQQKQAAPVRKLLASTAQSLVHAGHLAPQAVSALQLGRGAVSSAKYLVGLSSLFQGLPAAIVDKTPVTQEQIAKGAELGSWLVDNIRPTNARKVKDVSLVEAQQTRDRFHTLLLRGYLELRRVGMWLWVDDVNDHVPLLASRERVVSRSTSTPTPPPPPVVKPIELSPMPPSTMTVSVVVPANSEVKKS